MCFFRARNVNVYSFGSRQQRKLFPLYHPPNQLGNYFLPLRGSPHVGPGRYIAEDHGLAYKLSKIPTSTKGYTLGARTATRFKSLSKDVTPYPGKYQKVTTSEEKHKQNFVPFNVLIPRSGKCSKDISSYPGPGAYNPEKKTHPKITWPMQFGSPDWAEVSCLQKRTLKAELSTDREFKKHRNRIAYFRLFYK